jgi:anti-anti-sigma regulatory factor
MVSLTSVEALRPGDHACLTFSDAEERLDIVAAFVRDGIRYDQKVVCFTEALPVPALPDQLAERGVAVQEPLVRGQLAVLGSEESWLVGGTFDSSRMIQSLVTQVERARRDGYAGLRVSADMCWATRPVAGIEQLVVFESEVNQLFAGGLLTAICQYDRNSFDAVTLASTAAAHPQTVAATVYHEDPVLRVCRQHSPPGVRLAGEIDYTTVTALRQALGEAVRLDREIQVNLASLRFIDAAAASVVVQAALGLAPGQRMIVICDGLVSKVLGLVGADEVPNLVVANGTR